MHEITCPHCGRTFTIDEAGYADIVKQVRDAEFERQLHERLELAEQDKTNAHELAETTAASELQKTAAAKDSAIQELTAKPDAREVTPTRHLQQDAPAVLRASTYFWLASALVSGVVPAIVMVVRPSEPELFAVTMGLLLLLTALQSWAALKLLRGKRWAWIVLSAVAVLSLGGTFSAVPTPLVVIVLVLTLAGAVLMWIPASSAYLRRSSAAG